METRRLLLFLVLSFGFVLIWTKFVVPRQPVPDADPAVAVNNDDGPPLDDSSAQTNPETSEKPSNGASAEPPAATPTAENDSAPDVFDAEIVVLGSDAADDGYALQVETTTLGASISSVQLADPRMTELNDRQQQVQVLGTNVSKHDTFQNSVDLIDAQLERHSSGMRLENIHWEVRNKQRDSVTFAYRAPDGALEVEKLYRIHPITGPPESRPLRTEPSAYTVECQLSVRNLSNVRQIVRYELLGPCGIILENSEHTRKYRDIKLEFLQDDSSDVYSAAETQTVWNDARLANPLLSDEQLNRVVREGEDKWIRPVRYAGVDVQFFAALLSPDDERSPEQQEADPWIQRIWPVLLQGNRTSTFADITFRMESLPRTLEPAGQAGDALRHNFSLFVGPKHGALLDPPPFEAEQVLDYGSYFGFIARGMHSVLSFLYGIGLPYWLAIISLTVMVRCCLFPLSRKQAISAARMKELQPKINELKLKYGDDKEKMAKAQMDLWRKYDINPLGGCMPLFFQLPVFIGLYTCLNTAVDLRLSSFLWIENLAAPDALFRMPFQVPFLGQDFNVLPCVNVVLFLVQQKLFMPPPTDEQQEMQHKMMNVMTIFFAVMFWHVPAGLCMYFVASSLWSIGERKLLGSDVLTKKATLNDADSDAVEKAPSNPKRNGKQAENRDEAGADSGRPRGFLQKLMDAAEQAKAQAEQDHRSEKGTAGRSKSGGKGRKGGKKR